MKVRRYDELLRARGYKIQEHVDYEGTDIYIKKHLKNTIVCYVKKDTHGKAQTIRFHFEEKQTQPKDFEEFKAQEFDREYLWREANKIYVCFEQLKQMKSPKHIYF